jgi:cyclopropane fatty-acyl-phospholipid synthase-like methyltransferase
MKIENDSSNIALYFEKKWDIFKKWCYADKTLAIHYGYYDKYVKNYKKAVLNMNDLIAKLLNLNINKTERILDAGCGVGGTSMYLGKKYSNIRFTGITNSKKQVDMGKEFIKRQMVNNFKIFYGDFTNTDFPDDYFDSVFAIESVGYSIDVKDFIAEMKRILKPCGNLIVLDGFRTKEQMNPFEEKIYKIFLFGRGYEKLDLPHLQRYLTLLKNFRFNDIKYKDISKNVAPSQIRGIIIALPFFFSFLLKYLLSFGVYDCNKNFFDFSMGVAVMTPLIAYNKISRYCVITAKKEVNKK